MEFRKSYWTYEKTIATGTSKTVTIGLTRCDTILINNDTSAKAITVKFNGLNYARTINGLESFSDDLSVNTLTITNASGSTVTFRIYASGE